MFLPKKFDIRFERIPVEPVDYGYRAVEGGDAIERNQPTQFLAELRNKSQIVLSVSCQRSSPLVALQQAGSTSQAAVLTKQL